MSPIFLLLLLHILPQISGGPTTNYCSLRCGREKHTVCKRGGHCGPVGGCENIESDVAFRKYMVQVHNELRNDIASGKEKGPYGNNGALNMMAISYDLELEYIAACWANACHGMKHDKCRNSKRFSVGQNIFWGVGVNETEKAVRAWFAEIQYVTNADWITHGLKAFPKDGKQRGHFTQVVWATTKYIGCGRTAKGRQRLLLCNYAPAGNYLGMPIYKIAAGEGQVGAECSKLGGKNAVYPALCGTIQAIPTEKQWAGGVVCAVNGRLLAIALCLGVVL